MLFAIGFVFTFINGGLTGLFLGNVTVDLPLSDTMFVVAHFHMVMAVSPILVVFGAIYHWYPKITGRMLTTRWASFTSGSRSSGPMPSTIRCTTWASWACRAGITPIGGTDFIPESAHSLNEGITIAALIVGAVQLVFLYNLIWSYFKGKPSGGNPWRATTLEWQTPDTPPEARQLRPEAAGGLSLGVRLQRARRRGRLHSAEPAAGQGEATRWARRRR